MKAQLNSYVCNANIIKSPIGGGNSHILKSLFTIILLLTIGVTNTWAGTRRIYFDYSNYIGWKDFTNLSGGAGHAKVHCWGGNQGDQDYEMSQVEGENSLAYCDIDDGWTDICFFRCGSDNVWWTKTFDYNNIGSNNYFKIKNETQNDGILDKYKWDYAQRWTPSPAIDGLLDPNNPHNQAFDGDGVFTATLDAHTTYQFKILDGSTAYGLDNNVWTSSISDYTLNSTGYYLRLCTAGAGIYTFTYNRSSHQLSVTYPVVDHPNIDYCYLQNYGWSNTYLGVWNSASGIANTESNGTQITNTVPINDVSYFYFSPGDYANLKFGDASSNGNDNLNSSDGYGKFQSYISEDGGWKWRTFTVRIQLDDRDATTDVVPDYLDVAFNSDVLADLTTVPAKTHYDFGGFYTNSDGTGTQVIDASGHWIASVPDYTDASKHWIHAGTSTTLYAKWTEHPYTVTTSVSPAGAGTLSCGASVEVGYVTPSALITATANPAWKFARWEYGTNVGPVEGTGNDNTVQITAAVNGTLTAVFEPRFCLVGSIWDNSGNGGMPGWSVYTADFNVNSYTDLNTMNLTCVRSLDPNTTYKFEVHDKVKGQNLGYTTKSTYIGDQSLLFNTQNEDVMLRVNGHGECTFTISALTSGDLYPTVSVSIPSSHLLNLSWANVRINGDWYKTSDAIGGTVSAQTTESGNRFAIHNGEYVAHGGAIEYTATPAAGYMFDGWYNSDYNYRFSTTNPYTSSNIQTTENVEAKFVEKAANVTINTNNTRAGSVRVDDGAFTWGNSTTAGVTTKRALLLTTNTGYNFTGWSLSSTPDFELQDKASESDTEVTLAGLGGTNGSSGTLTANFAAKTYTVTLNDDQGGTHNGTATAAYHSTALSSITHADVSGWMRLGYWNTDGNQVTNADGTLRANVPNYTNSSGEWIYDNNVTLYAHWYRIITLDKNGGTADGTIGVDYKGSTSSLSIPARSGYSIEGFYAEPGCTSKVMNSDGTLVNCTGYVENGKWINKSIDRLYTKWIFVIYRTGDKAEDPRAQTASLESYAGGTIQTPVEFRMKVRTIDQWTSLCLPFTVNAVQVWDEADGAYYDIVPYYRTNGSFYIGHYIIRTPKQTTDFPLADFDDWTDPESAEGFLPAKNTPYIIQWHDTYFLGKYISFFGSADQTIPAEFNAGTAPVNDNVVNVWCNTTMKSGSVRDVYLLEGDYGGAGAWLREDIGTDRSVLPFECFIRASDNTTRAKRILRPENPDNTTTGIDGNMQSEADYLIVYTITGLRVAEYNRCSLGEVSKRLAVENGEGLYILQSRNGVVKLLVEGE